MTTETAIEYLKTRKLRCPKCGAPVFMPGTAILGVRAEDVSRDDPLRWPVCCTDMGHWAGLLEDCDGLASG